MRVMKAFFLGLVAMMLGCSAELSDYQDASPRFDLFGYFEGRVDAWGMVQDRSGKQTRRFYVELNGSIEGNVLTLDEKFEFDDGEKSTRIWVITRLNDGTYEGS
ncbi:putative lipoprotein precursor [Vibrio ishigakensis]|uniref:Putative lipoprotein n=1 Tax=Vibrio ishigakensis TaxID=1481914 RepID=A0A0B8PAL4_9VIBR|nr:putative lipoprotein precursor [Vibrio ishigakensis]